MQLVHVNVVSEVTADLLLAVPSQIQIASSSFRLSGGLASTAGTATAVAGSGAAAASSIATGMSSDEEEYEVERILDERKGGAEFKVKWLGFSVSEATWEPAALCAGCGALVAEFRKQQKTDGEKRKATKPPAKTVKAKKIKKTPAAAAVAVAAAAASTAASKKHEAPVKKPTAKKAASPPGKVEWFVEVCTYCSGVGCYYGSDPDEWPDPTTKSHGPYASEAQAQSAARGIRQSECQFESWAEVFNDDDPPPWDSADMQNMDEDEYVSIEIVSSAARAAAATKALAKVAKELDRAATSVARPAPPLKPGGKVGLDTSLTVREDIQMFARHPAASCLGGTRTAASAFPKGFPHMIQRLSDMCYSVAAYCADPSRGARYALKKYPRALCKSVVWVPPPGCGLGGPLAPAPNTLIDCVHTDMINHADGKPLWTPWMLLAAASSATTVLFLNDHKKQHEDATTEMIEKCSQLEVIVMVECDLTEKILTALAKRGGSLVGVHLHMCNDCGLLDEHYLPLLSACNRLLWLSLSFSGNGAGSFDQRAWDAIPGSVRVLELPAKGYGSALKAKLEALRSPMTNAVRRMGEELAYFMIARDDKGKTRVEKQGSGTIKITVKGGALLMLRNRGVRTVLRSPSRYPRR